MKGEVLLQLVDRLEVPLLACPCQLLEGGVRASDVGGVMFTMMQLEQPRGVVWLQRRIAVWQFRQFYTSSSLSLRSMTCLTRSSLEATRTSGEVLRSACAVPVQWPSPDHQDFAVCYGPCAMPSPVSGAAREDQRSLLVLRILDRMVDLLPAFSTGPRD